MEYIIAVIYGLVQGLTEFLPVSSSGHLLLLHKFFNSDFLNSVSYDVALHLSTLLAVAVYFRSDISLIIKDWLKGWFGPKREGWKMGWLLIISSLPAGFAGFLFEDRLETYFYGLKTVIVMLSLVSILFIIAEVYLAYRKKERTSISYLDSLVIGLAQVLALIPGTSRSGITIVAGLFSGFSRRAAVRFSFLMSIPIIVGASFKKIPNLFVVSSGNSDFFYLSLSFLTALISGYLAIAFIMRYMRNGSLIPFAIYRLLLAALLIFFL